jgi:hypothetical protein
MYRYRIEQIRPHRLASNWRTPNRHRTYVELIETELGKCTHLKRTLPTSDRRVPTRAVAVAVVDGVVAGVVAAVVLAVGAMVAVVGFGMFFAACRRGGPLLAGKTTSG